MAVKVTGNALMEDLRKWVKEKWVDIGAPKKGGGYKPCGRSEGEKRKGYPKCVPAAKASSMSKKQKKSAVKRKRAAGNPGGKPTMVSTLKKTSKKSESMTRFKEALNELRGKYAAKRAKAYQDQHRGVRPVRGTPDQEDAAERATRDPQRPGKRGGYNDSVVAASQGLITTRGGEKVSADHVAKTFRKAGKHAVRKARKASGKPTYGRRPDGSRMSTGQGGRGDTRKKASRNESLERFKTVILEKLCAKGKAAAKRKFDVYPSAYANMYGSAVCSGKVTPGGKKGKKNESGEGIGVRPSKGDTTGVARGGEPITPQQRAQALIDDQSDEAKARRLAKAQEIADRRGKNK